MVFKKLYNNKFINNDIYTFILNDIKRITGIKEEVNVTIIDLYDNGPVIIFLLNKK